MYKFTNQTAIRNFLAYAHANKQYLIRNTARKEMNICVFEDFLVPSELLIDENGCLVDVLSAQG